MANPHSPAVLILLRGRVGRAVSAATAFFFAMTSLSGLMTPAAWAGDLPRVVVLTYAPIYDSLPRASGEKAAELLSAELKSSEQLQLVTVKMEAPAARPKATNPAPARDDSRLTEAKERSGKAQEFIRQLKFKQAAGELEAVISLLETQHPYIDFEDLVNAYLDLAVAYFRLGQDGDGEKLLAQVVRLDPERKLDAEKYPPVFLRIYGNISNKVKAAPKGTVRVDNSASGALVFLDGREMGRAPVTINDVVKGPHFVRLVPPGGEPWAERVEVAPGEDTRLAPALGGSGPADEITAALARNTIDQPLLDRVLAIARQAQADYVVLGGVHREKDQVVMSSHLLRADTGRTCLLQRVVFDEGFLGAGIEIYKVGADVANKVEVFGSEESLPAKVARDALPSGKSVPTVSAVAANDTRVADKTDTTKTPDAFKPDPRTTVAGNGEPDFIREPDAPPDQPPGIGQPRGDTWIWVLAGACAVGAAAAGGYFAYDYATRPVTGTATVTW